MKANKGSIFILTTLTILSAFSANAQSLESSVNLLGQIGAFEGQRDPKCAATANRLEDFMYGTPLNEGARIVKAELQKELIRSIWIKADKLQRKTKATEISMAVLDTATAGFLRLEDKNDHFLVRYKAGTEKIMKRDYRHYSSVAYAYRALLAVQQEMLFNKNENLLPLSVDATTLLKLFTDISTLAVLKIADQVSREKNETEISPERFKQTWKKVFEAPAPPPAKKEIKTIIESRDKQLALVRSIIENKQKAFEKYNDISMYLFQRNAQVYFSRHAWPKDSLENREFRATYNETLIQFVKNLWTMAEQLAKKQNKALIGMDDISAALEAFLPYSANQLEDITFFPKLSRDKQIDLEAYDLDAFRDGGVHWTYIEMALNDTNNFKPILMPDPFALELLSEGIAHLGVLSLRMAGDVAKEKNIERLSTELFIEGMKRLQALITESGTTKTETKTEAIASSPEKKKTEDLSTYFTETTQSSGIDFEHRSADWLSRFIRSYSVDTAERIVKTSIPPAFGGGGIAAEDVNNDGLPDVLLLSGLGNKLYINNGDALPAGRQGTFSDKTNASGLNWTREDKTPGEPRQPIIADFDNDGLQDIFISYVNDEHRIYRNKGNAVFEDMTSTASLGGKETVGGPCTAFDFDNDGLLDIYIGYFGDYLHGILPTLARKNKNGLPNKLFRNLGNFKFEEVKNAGVEDIGWTQSVGHADINGDNFQDIISGNDFGTNSYYLNNGNGTFRDATRELGTDKPSFTMNVGITDLNRDHFPDFYISNIVVMEKDEKYVRPEANMPMKFNQKAMANMRVVEANDLFLSSKNDKGAEVYDLSKNITRGYSATGWSWDADFFDFDNDGDQDLYCLTGMNDFLVYSTENPYYQDPNGLDKNVLFPESKREPNVFFENEKGMLNTLEGRSGLDVVYNSRSAVYLDMDMDGDEDIVMNNYHDKAVVFKNNAEKEGNNWIKIRLIGNADKKVNRDAIGAKITVTATDLDVWREIHSTTGYLSVHPKEQHIGLGKVETVTVNVTWPDGTKQEFKNVKANQRYTLAYGETLK